MHTPTTKQDARLADEDLFSIEHLRQAQECQRENERAKTADICSHIDDVIIEITEQ